MTVPVLEIGGTHVTGALVDAGTWRVVSSTRLAVEGDASASALLARFTEAADAVDAPVGADWGVAMPDPFDYVEGIGRFEGVGKFTALYGVDVRAAMQSSLAAGPGRLSFLNDADAFVLGEWTAGVAVDVRRCVGITLGTGVGSGWLVDGRPVDPGQPPGGRIHLMRIEGRPLEDVVSRRALRRAFAAAGGDPALDVREIADAARRGDAPARRVLDGAFTALGQVVGECVARFAADLLVIGGSMAASWDLFEPAFRSGAAESGLPEVRLARDSDTSPLIGAAAYARRVGG